MPLNITRVSAQDIKLKVLVYGAPGVGKTTLAATVNDDPDLAPALVLNLEGGLLSLASRGDVDSVDIRNTRELEDVIEAFRRGDPDVAKYRTIILDSGSEFASQALREWVGINSQRAERKGKGDPDRRIDDVQLEDYGKTTAQVRRVFAMLRDLPLHVIVTSLPKTNQVNNIPTEVVPAFTNALVTAVTGMFDHVWMLYVHDGTDDAGNPVQTRVLSTRKNGLYVGKTRGARFAEALGPYVPEPSFATIYRLMLTSETPDAVDAMSLPVSAQETPETDEPGF